MVAVVVVLMVVAVAVAAAAAVVGIVWRQHQGRLAVEDGAAPSASITPKKNLVCKIISGVAQWLACWAHTPKVRGSKPRSANVTVERPGASSGGVVRRVARARFFARDFQRPL